MEHYAERNIMELDRQGGYYLRHASAMTGEGLHEKCDIAAELGYRDMIIDNLCDALEDLLQICEIRSSYSGRQPTLTEYNSAKDNARATLAKARGES